MFENYSLKLFAVDVLFVSDLIGNGVWGANFYQAFEHIGIPTEIMNLITCALELIRLFSLIYLRK